MNSTRKLTKDVKQSFTHRFEGRNTGLPSKINIKGYYRYLFKDEFGRYKTISLNGTRDTSFQNVMFYEDGTFVTNVGLRRNYNSYEDYFNSIIKNGEKDFFYTTASDWGIYTLSGDTIKTQYLMLAAKFTPWYSGEEWYLIKDRNSIQLILFKSDLNQSIDDAKIHNDSYVQGATVAKFYPVSNIPPSYNWMKQNKFFWRNEEDWNFYMRSVFK